MIITVSSPSYRPYRQEDTSGYFDIFRKVISKPGSMEAFFPGNLPESQEVYKIVKDIRLQNIIGEIFCHPTRLNVFILF